MRLSELRKFVRRQWLRIVLIVVGVVFLFAGHLMLSIACYSGSAEKGTADAAIVLGAAVWKEEPSPVFRERINHAIALYHDHRVQMLIFTGGKGDSAARAESEVARDYALKQKVAPESILIETKSHKTRENLLMARDLARDHSLGNFLIVSDPLHMKRAMVMARDIGLNAAPSPTSTTRYRSWTSKLPFLTRETYYYFTYLMKRPFLNFADGGLRP